MKIEDNWIEKSNILNTMQSHSIDYEMTLNEFRLFCMYLSKINARVPEERTTVISIEEFEKLFDIKFNTSIFNKKIRRIAGKNIEIKVDDEIEIVNIYSKFAWVDKKDCKEIKITCNSDIVPFLFELQKNYTAYRLANISKLNSVGKIRLYEILKQYEKVKSIQIPLEELQAMMSSGMSEFRYFRIKMLEPAVQEINKYTDISVSYKKVLKMRKVVAIAFTISSQMKDNKTAIGSSDLSVIEVTPITVGAIDDNSQLREYLKLIGKSDSEAEQLIYEVNIIINDRLKDGNKIKDTYKYAKGIIDRKIEQEKQREANAREKYKQKEMEPQSYDIDNTDDLAVNIKYVEKYKYEKN